MKALLDAGASPYSMDDKGKTPIELCKAPDPEYGRIAVLLVEAGDFHLWDGIKKPCPGLEAALMTVWEKKPNQLPAMFKCFTPAVQSQIQAALRAMKRGGITELTLRIMAEVLKA